MLFNSLSFLIFLPIVTVLYFIFPKKYKWLWLLVCSYYFYMSWDAKYAGLMLLSTLITYLSGLGIKKAGERKSIKNIVVAVSFLSNLGILFFFKYFNFLNDLMASIFGKFSLNWGIESFNVLLPVGISFYTFQALSYTMDVYRGKVEPEGHFGKYALFVSFFPQLVAGPIENSYNLLPQMHKNNKFDFERLNSGLIMMGWGYFKKVVVADRLAVFVDSVYNAPTYHEGITLIIATLFFAVQIYCDFSGYTDIAIGTADILGFKLMKNFDKPYFSKTIAEFWRRWHISLGGWFREYLYIPLGGNRVSRLRKNINIMIVFLTSGLWHGASLSFVVWGGLHGLYQIVGDYTEEYRKKIVSLLKLDQDAFLYRLIKIALTFLLTCFAWIFFRANRLLDSVYIVKNLFKFNYWVLSDDSLYKLGLDRNEFLMAVISIIILFLIDLLNRKNDVIERIRSKNIFLRWIIYFTFIFGILVFGNYGTEYDAANFIYFQF